MTRSRAPGAPQAGRREFLKSGAATALVLAIGLPRGPTRGATTAATAPFQPSAFLRIGTDGWVTVICPVVEMGQGVLTAIPMLLCEELDAPFNRVRVEQAPTDPAYDNPLFKVQGTGGSTSIRAFWAPLREAGARARAMLVAAAAQQWGVDPATLRTEQGVVIGPGDRRAPYGTLVARAAKQPVPALPELKKTTQFTLIGQPLPRLDSAIKSNGSAQFGIDAPILPGRLVAVMARAPLPGARPLRVDDARARAVPGVKQVLAIPNGVAVLATGYWAAKRGRDALTVDWDLGGRAGLSSAAISAELTEAAAQAKAVAHSVGDPTQAIAARTVEAVYEVPYLAHACMEPLNCTAWLGPRGLEVWTGTQGQGSARAALSKAIGLPPEKVVIHPMLLGGGFGRRYALDFVIDASLLSKLSGQPVQLIYSREDDMAAGYYRPAAVARLKAGLDAEGRPVRLEIGVGSPSIAAASGFQSLPDNGVDEQAMEGISDHPYDIAHQRIAYGRAEPGPQVWFWRSVGHSQNIFFIESFVDELAAAARIDPYQFRRALVEKRPRYCAVLDTVADKAGWGSPLPAGVFRGIAVAKCFGSFVAQVAEVSVNADGVPKVHRVVAAIDCGLQVNPRIIERQVESAIVYGLSAALYGRISYREGRVVQGNFNDYPILRMSEMPKVEVHILSSGALPGGVGEPGTPPIAPAVANAIYAATGKRIRRLPIDPADLKRA